MQKKLIKKQQKSTTQTIINSKHMKLLNQIYQWFLNLFRTKDEITNREINKMQDIVQKMEASRTNKQKRDWWLFKKGYTVRHDSKQKQELIERRVSKSLRKEPLSSYASQVKRFMILKFKNKIEIYRGKRNRQGIPYFEIRKSVKQQVSTITAK